MGEDGARYKVTKYPKFMDIMGLLPRSKQTDPKNDPQPDPNKPGTSNNLGMQSPSLDELFFDLQWNDNKDRKGESGVEHTRDHREAINEIKVTKVFQDDPLKEVYRDYLETYYATTKHRYLEMPLMHVVIVKRLGEISNRIRDK